MRIRAMTVCILVFALILGVIPLSAACNRIEQDIEVQQKSEITPGDYSLLQYAMDPQISPDGMTVAFVAGQVRSNYFLGIETRQPETLKRQIYLADLSGRWTKQLTDGPSDSDPAWSPDGSELAFTRLVDGMPQVFLLNVQTGSAKQLTLMKHGAFEPAWSPDGERIVFTSLVEEETENEFGDPKVIRVFPYIIPEPSPVGFPCKDDQRPHLFICSKSGKELRQLTFGDVLDYSPSWSLDGQNILYTSVKLSRGFPSIKTVPASGGEPRELLRVKIPSAPGKKPQEVVIPAKFPAWSPDGQLIAYNQFGNMMAELPVGVIATIDGEPRTLTSPEYRRFYPTWSDDGKLIYFIEEKEGNGNLKSVSLETGDIKEITDIEGIVLSFDVAKDKIVYTATEPTNPSDVCVYDLSTKKTTKITNLNAQLLNKSKLVHPTSFWFNSFDGTLVQAWYYLPLQYEEGKKYPLIQYIHGGPCAMWGNEFDFISQVLAANGYIVLKINYRGSTGYGSNFSLPPGNPASPDILPIKFYEEMAFKDFMAGLDAVIEKGFVNENRMGVMGGSWGGVLTGWTITHTERFKAAISDRTSWEPGGFAEWFMGGPIWENPDVYREYSPVTYMNKIKTPTLVVAGENDLLAPPLESEKLFAALKRVGVPTELVIYPRETHGLCEQEHVVDYMQRVVGWFDTYLTTSKGGASSTEEAYSSKAECGY